MSSFVSRFDSVSSQLRQVHLGQMLAWSALVAAGGVLVLAAADYLWELPYAVRLVGLSAVGLGAAIVAVAGLIHVYRRWTRPQTAVAIEHQFPELGQRVRTVVQYQSPIETEADGVAPQLAVALAEETSVRAEPLPLNLVVPVQKLKAIGGAVAAVVAVMVLLAISHPDWRVALQRSLLSKQPWTNLAVTPGNATVREGESLTVKMQLTGRTNHPVTITWRPADDATAEWTEQAFEARADASRKADFSQSLQKIRRPIEYRVVAGNLQSPAYRIDVRHPLKMTGLQVTLTPPAYTGLKPSIQKDGNVHGLAGTKVGLKFDLDGVAARAKLVLTSAAVPQNGDPTPEPIELPLKIQGKSLSTSLELTEDQTYTVVAESKDGMALVENKYRIRVRPDQAPTVWFEDPPEALEVHSLVEVLMKIRSRDDFGLSKVGIVFQVNNEEEHTLFLDEFEEALKDGKSPQTQALREAMLPLEHFELTQRDSVTYYAFAEDNFPGGAHRTETDLRFVDIRPFRRIYRLPEEGQPGDSPDNMNNKPLASLEELIGRQRYALNQTMRMGRQKKPDAAALEKLVTFESNIASATLDVARRLEFFQLDGADLLFQAEKSMSASVDSLQVGKFENATLQERDALRYLIEGRDKVEMSLSNKPRDVRELVRAYDRTQVQKLRRPKAEAETAAEVVEQLKRLAAAEDFVYETLVAATAPVKNAPPSKSKTNGQGGTADPDMPPMSNPEGMGETRMPMEGASGKGTSKSDDPAGTPPDAGQPDGNKSENDKPGTTPEGDKPASEKSADSDKPGTGDKQDPQPAGGDDGERSDEPPKGMTREELLARQQEISQQAYEIQKALEKLQGVSDLAKQRIADAAKSAEDVQGAMDRGQSEEAAKQAARTAGMFKELARNVEGLLADETAQQVAIARQISDELAAMERDLADAIQKQKGMSGPSGEKPADKNEGNGQKGSGGKTSEDLKEEASQLAQSGRTLEDILKAINKSNAPADQEAVRQISQLLSEGKLQETFEKMQALTDKIGEGEKRDAVLVAEDAADNLESAARKLETLHQQIVAPRVADLMKLEQKVSDLVEDLENRETQMQITEWHREADELIDELKKAGIGAAELEELKETMKDGGWGVERKARNWGWALDGRRYGAPVRYLRVTRKVLEKVQAHIQELVLRDMVAAGDEAAPPQFETQIQKYYELLSSELTGKK